MPVLPFLVSFVIMLSGLVWAELPKPKPKPAPDKALLECFLPNVQADHLEARVRQLRGLTYILIGVFQPGMESESPLAVMAYPYKGYGQMNPFPTMYQIDRDQDGQLDEEWVDEMGNGRCDQMRQVPLQTPDDKEM